MFNSKINTLVRNSAWLYYGRIVSQVFNIIISVLVIKKLQVEVYGTYNLLINTFFVFQIFGSGQLSILLNRYIPELFEGNQFRMLKKLILYGLFFSILVLFVLLSILFILKEEFAHFFKVTDFDLYIQPFFFYIVFYFLFVIFKSIITSLLLQKNSSLMVIVQAIARLLLYLVFFAELTIGILLYIEGIIAIIFIVGSLWVLYRLDRTLDYSAKPLPDARPVNKGRMIKFGLLGSLNELGSGIIGGTSDYFIISAIGNPYAVGLYAFAFRIKSMIANIFPLNEFTSVIRPLFFQKFSRNYDKQNFIWLYNFMIKAIMPILVIPGLYFFIFGREVIIYVFDPEYMEAYTVTCVVILGHIINGIFYPVGITVHLKERMEIALYSKVVVIFSIFAGILGMEYFGIIGVALISICGNLLKNLFMIGMMKKFADIQYRLLEYKNCLIQVLILTALFYFTTNLINNIFTLFAWSFLFGVMALFLMVVLHPFTGEDLVLLNKISETSSVLKKLRHIVAKVYRLKGSLS